MKHKIFFVLGGESTGTRLITRLLVDAGCFGDINHDQRMDTWAYKHTGSLEKRLQKGQPLVWRRSFPHNKKMPCIMEDLVYPVLRLHGVNRYDDVMFLVTMRNWFCAARSATKVGHSETEEDAIEKLKQAYTKIFSFFAKNPFFDYRMVHYEWLVSWRPFALSFLYKDCGFEVDRYRVTQIAETLRNENDKWLVEYVNEQTKK